MDFQLGLQQPALNTMAYHRHGNQKPWFRSCQHRRATSSGRTRGLLIPCRGVSHAIIEELVDYPGSPFHSLGLAKHQQAGDYSRAARRQVNLLRRLKADPWAMALTSPPDWSAMFSDLSRPLVADLGCGAGRCMLAAAAAQDAAVKEAQGKRAMRPAGNADTEAVVDREEAPVRKARTTETAGMVARKATQASGIHHLGGGSSTSVSSSSGSGNSGSTGMVLRAGAVGDGCNFLGVDVRLALTSRAAAWAQLTHLNHRAAFLCANANASLPLLLGSYGSTHDPGCRTSSAGSPRARSVALVCLQFSDPPVRRQALVGGGDLVAQLAEVLEPGAMVWIQSDVLSIARSLRRLFWRHGGFAPSIRHAAAASACVTRHWLPQPQDPQPHPQPPHSQLPLSAGAVPQPHPPLPSETAYRNAADPGPLAFESCITGSVRVAGGSRSTAGPVTSGVGAEGRCSSPEHKRGVEGSDGSHHSSAACTDNSSGSNISGSNSSGSNSASCCNNTTQQRTPSTLAAAAAQLPLLLLHADLATHVEPWLTKEQLEQVVGGRPHSVCQQRRQQQQQQQQEQQQHLEESGRVRCRSRVQRSPGLLEQQPKHHQLQKGSGEGAADVEDQQRRLAGVSGSRALGGCGSDHGALWSGRGSNLLQGWGHRMVRAMPCSRQGILDADLGQGKGLDCTAIPQMASAGAATLAAGVAFESFGANSAPRSVGENSVVEREGDNDGDLHVVRGEPHDGEHDEGEDGWEGLPWLDANPLGVPTERELYVERGRRPIYRLLLVRR
ncbi:hypothetical protein Agub_g10626 [Astrephomene gubernaculifera]|uniref:tRNA (guanine(46)-N(7))-methyltransferase n=1 Tax=Astrephomene gubernaculifera TaxID=47775 RepID=A0AAD3DVC2_9CHLO|nr:hypothetical protein Agub_g10626 [Astrephomene gubernaculifera]